jgi:hypothetical protein
MAPALKSVLRVVHLSGLCGEKTTDCIWLKRFKLAVRSIVSKRHLRILTFVKRLLKNLLFEYFLKTIINDFKCISFLSLRSIVEMLMATEYDLKETRRKEKIVHTVDAHNIK